MTKYFLKSTIIPAVVVGLIACSTNVKDIVENHAPEKKLASSTLEATAAQIYFQQDFNSSTDYTSYVGSGTNQFDGLVFNGNASINTLNNKLQIVKNGGTGTNRAGVTKTDRPFNPTGVGGFLKFEMEVTISKNTPGTNVSTGFLFSVGMNMSGTAPADPGDGNVHSAIYISPVATEGAFIVRGRTPSGTISSEALTGTQKLVWYINNSGTPAGYAAPDGVTLASVLNDASDVWAIDESGKAVLILDDVPALTPSLQGLRQFKISNNANFVATLDIDDIIISEEPVVILKKITSVTPVESVSAPVKTIFSLLPLPAYIDVTLEDGETDRAAVRWSEVTKYNPYRLGEYEVRGDIIANSGTINLDELYLTSKVKLREEFYIIDAFSPNGDGINDTWIIPDLKCFNRTSVEVLDRDGNRLFYSTDPNVGWDGKNKNGQIIAGSYYYIIKVPDLLMEKRGTVTVIK